MRIDMFVGVGDQFSWTVKQMTILCRHAREVAEIASWWWMASIMKKNYIAIAIKWRNDAWQKHHKRPGGGNSVHFQYCLSHSHCSLRIHLLHIRVNGNCLALICCWRNLSASSPSLPHLVVWLLIMGRRWMMVIMTRQQYVVKWCRRHIWQTRQTLEKLF